MTSAPFGFVLNPYDPCVANKGVVKGKQLTIVWHVDDLKVMPQAEGSCFQVCCLA